MSLCLEGLTTVNRAFLVAHKNALESGSSALQGPLGRYVAASVNQALEGERSVWDTAFDIAETHRSNELYEMARAGCQVKAIDWQKVRSRTDGLGRLARDLEGHAQFRSLPIRQLLMFIQSPLFQEGNFAGDLEIYQNVNRAVSQALGITGLYEKDDDLVLVWDLPADFLMLGPEILFGDEAVRIQLTSEMSQPREVRDLLEKEDAWPVWIWPGEQKTSGNGTHRPGTREVHELQVKTSGLFRHDLFHVWWASWQGRAHRLETVAIYDGLEAAVGAPITFESPTPVLEAADVILSGLNMSLDGDRVRYKTYIQKIYKTLGDPQWVLALHDQIRDRFPRHPHLFHESIGAAAPYRRRSLL